MQKYKQTKKLQMQITHSVFHIFSVFFRSGVQDEEGNDLIPIPSWWGKVVYKAGTKITYINDVKFPDRLEIEGPTNMPLRIVVSID